MTQIARPDVVGVFDPASHTISYVVSDPATGAAAIIDPVLDFDPAAARTSTGSLEHLLALVADRGLSLQYVLETHAHADHLTGAHEIRERTGAPIGIGEKITRVQKTFGDIFEAGDVRADASVFDHAWTDGARFSLGEIEVEVLHTPGHTPACVSYRIGDAVFVGDTLFMPDFGTARADFPGGDARTLYRSIQKVLSLPPETRLFLCHDYKAPGRDHYAWETTVAEQRAANVHVRDGTDEGEFVAMREARDAKLAVPRLLLPSIQVNIRAGRFPQAEANGVRYLLIPVKAKTKDAEAATAA